MFLSIDICVKIVVLSLETNCFSKSLLSKCETTSLIPNCSFSFCRALIVLLFPSFVHLLKCLIATIKNGYNFILFNSFFIHLFHHLVSNTALLCIRDCNFPFSFTNLSILGIVTTIVIVITIHNRKDKLLQLLTCSFESSPVLKVSR